MRNLIILLLILVSTNCFSQDWAERITKKFYSEVDSAKKFDCCDKSTNALSMNYSYVNFEIPFPSKVDVLDEYYTLVIDSATVEIITKELVNSYNKIPKKLRNNFTKSCFDIETKTTITHGYNNELIFVEGTVNFVFSFQMDKPYKRSLIRKIFGMI